MKNRRKLGIFVVCGLFVLLICLWIRKWIKEQQYSERKWKEEADKYRLYTNVLSYWISKKQGGRANIEDYLQKHNIKKVAIYGMGNIGERLLEELKGSSIEVVFAIDQNSDIIWADVEMYTLKEKLPEVDAIIVTAFYFFDSIEKSLKEKTDCLIISLEDILCAI